MQGPLLPFLGGSASADPALVFPDRSLTYAELTKAAGALAASVTGAARVAVVADPRIETAVAVIGGLVAGVPVALINPKAGPVELEHVMKDAQPDMVFGGDDLSLDRLRWRPQTVDLE